MKADVSAAKQQALAITPNEYNVILVVEGYDILLNKIKAYEQRLFKNQVLQGLNVEEQRRRRKMIRKCLNTRPRQRLNI